MKYSKGGQITTESFPTLIKNIKHPMSWDINIWTHEAGVCSDDKINYIKHGRTDMSQRRLIYHTIMFDYHTHIACMVHQSKQERKKNLGITTVYFNANSMVFICKEQ